jgi:ubiquinone/menaquinone biosynthesis C-methylase UbiE
MFHPEGPSFVELMRQALSSTDDGYDLLASKFELTPFRTPDAVLGAIMPIVSERPCERALDVCCGTGAAARALARVATDRVVGIDRSRGMLAEASRLAARETGAVPASFLRGDALAMPFSGSFDVATCFGAFGHIEERDERRFARAILGALKPGGRFIFATTHMPSLASRTWWIARGFNAAMRVRNALIQPPFIMYYLTFTLPAVRELLEEVGFSVEVRDLAITIPGYSPEQRDVYAVIATRPG